MPRQRKAKTVNYTLVKEGQVTPDPYVFLRKLVETYHPHLLQARIAIAWRHGWSADKDGHLILGQCKKASDLSRELVDYDFVIVLNFEVWRMPEFDDKKKAALIDHELCHAQVSRDKDDCVRLDDRGRQVYRIRKHDVEDFLEVVQRHGLYKHDLEAMGQAILDNRNGTPLLEQAARSAKKRHG